MWTLGICPINKNSITGIEADLNFVLKVFPARPYHYYNVHQDNRTNKTHHNRILGESGKKLSSARHVNLVGHDKERAPEKCQVGAQALS